MAAKKKNSKKNKQAPIGWMPQILLIFILLAALAAMPTTVVLFFGLLPTVVAFAVDRTKTKTRVLTVGAMNIAGCAPFVLRLWATDHSLDNAFVIITDPRTIIVMYCAAGVGYILDWTVSGLIGTLMVSKATHRREMIKKRQAEMVERWGREVTGEVAVDASGFPVEEDSNLQKVKKSEKTGQ